jgi:hypothetical protein
MVRFANLAYYQSPYGLIPFVSPCLFLSSCLHPGYMVVLHLLRGIYSCVLSRENIHTLVLLLRLMHVITKVHYHFLKSGVRKDFIIFWLRWCALGKKKKKKGSGLISVSRVNIVPLFFSCQSKKGDNRISSVAICKTVYFPWIFWFLVDMIINCISAIVGNLFYMRWCFQLPWQFVLNNSELYLDKNKCSHFLQWILFFVHGSYDWLWSFPKPIMWTDKCLNKM